MSGEAATTSGPELPTPDSRGWRSFRGFVTYEFLLRAATRPPATQATSIELFAYESVRSTVSLCSQCTEKNI